MGITVIKIGGSAITDKNTGEDYIEEVVSRVARELIPGRKYILIHGIGYSGHRKAKEHNLFSGLGENHLAWARLRGEVSLMTRKILGILLDNGIPAVEVSLPEIMRTEDTETAEFRSDILREFIDLGFIPLMHGEAVLDPKNGLTVVSGDRIAVEIALAMDVNEIIFGTNVDGILDPLGRRIERLRMENLNSIALWDIGDFSGGMRNKIVEVMRLKDTRVRIINLREDGNLRRALMGEDVGTIIEP